MITLNTASGLATSGGTIALSGTVYNNNAPSQTFESIGSTSVITSAVGLTTTITAGGNVSANASSSPVAFSGLTAAQTYGAGAGLTHGTVFSMTLASVTITGSGAYGNNMSTPMSASNGAQSLTVTVTSAAITGGAVSKLNVANASISESYSKSPTDFVSPYTFHSKLGTGGVLSNFAVDLVFNGTTAIPAAAVGTVSIALGSLGTSTAFQGATVTGSTAAVSQGGFHGEAETVLATGSSTTYTSFIRIHNNSGNAGNVTVTVKNDGTGAALGSSFSLAVAANSTVTLSAGQIEGSAGITPVAGTNYTVDFAGQMTGYIQHVLFNPSTGALADMSSFRNGGQDNQAP